MCFRSRLADFFVNCQPEPRSLSGCLKENYADCLLAYSGLIGEFARLWPVRFDSGLTAVSKILKYENLLKTLLKMQHSFDMKNQAVIFCSYLTHNMDQSHSWFLPDNSYCNTRDLVLSSRQTWPRIHTLSTQRQFILPTAKQNGLFWTAASTREQSIGGVRNHWLKLFTFPRRERAYSSLHLLCILLPGETPPDCVSLVENKNHHC